MGSKVSKSWWPNIFLYGLSLGLLMAALQYSQYRLLPFNHTEKWYVVLVAVLFAVVGIWAGRKWTKTDRTLPYTLSPEFEANPATFEKLGITPRELEVLKAMAEGLSNQEIADKLFVSLNTVKTHISNVFSKLGVQRRTQAIQMAKSLGMLA